MMTLHLAALLSPLVFAFAANAAAQSAPIERVTDSQCTKLPGYLAGPFVPTTAIAEQMFRTIQSIMGDPKKFPRITVTDSGPYWSVGEGVNNPSRFDPYNNTGVMVGGAALYLRINKCTAEISQAAYSR